MPMTEAARIHGVLAEFDSPEALLQATRKAASAGFTEVEAYTPYPVHGLADSLGFTRTGIPALVFTGGLIGCISGYLLQYWVSVHAYPINVGGRPLHSWPSFIPVTFETTVLCAALFAVLGMLGLNGLPMPYHPVFNIPQFERASQDRFFLYILSRDEKFDLRETRRFLENLKPREVFDVPE